MADHWTRGDRVRLKDGSPGEWTVQSITPSGHIFLEGFRGPFSAARFAKAPRLNELDERLNAGAALPAEAPQGAKAGHSTCLECGAPFSPAAPHGDFCSLPCRRAFNNRRASRGAELYDLFMALRFERAKATELKIWKLLNRMAAHFRAEDEARRGGRKSWRNAKTVIERRPYLRADVLVGPTKRRK